MEFIFVLGIRKEVLPAKNIFYTNHFLTWPIRRRNRWRRPTLVAVCMFVPDVEGALLTNHGSAGMPAFSNLTMMVLGFTMPHTVSFPCF